MSKSRYDLSQCSWRLKGTAPYVPLRENSMETGKPLEGITGWIPADVPGGVALPLYRAGYIDHPYVGMNSLRCEWMENKWWIYETEFELPRKSAQKIRLDFEGVDYECAVYWDGCLLGKHTGMYEPFEFDVTERYQPGSTVKLRVLICHAPDETGQIGRTSETFTQKSRFNYKWDFSTRLVNLGIWQKVYLTFAENAEIEDFFAESDLPQPGLGSISVSAKISARRPETQLSWKAACTMDGKEISIAEGTVQPDGNVQLQMQIADPAVWYPNGMGKQPLYTLSFSIYEGSALLEERKQKIGIRRIRWLQNETAPEGARPYLFEVNGQKMYVKGVNITPLDHIYGDIPKEQVLEVLGRARDMNCNLVRVWGGGLIETEVFYQCCDEMGLLVWQDFIQSSSGIDNIPSQKPQFLELLRKSAEAAVRQKRCHTCLAVWSGGNELMEKDRKPCTEENPNIAMLHEIVTRLDPHRAFLPTSASGPGEFISKTPDQSHDVHGWWQYQGNPGHYSFYAGSDSLLHSEFGCDGMSSLASLKKILPEEELCPVPMHENDVWRFHGDWWCTYLREMQMFGEVQNIERYIACSQWMQAEGLRYILEANRRRMFRNSGSIIWQLNEPWPNISCTNLLEYHGSPKMAYYWAKQAFCAVHPVFEYRKLDYAPGEILSGRLSVLRDRVKTDEQTKLTAEIFDFSGKLLFCREYTADPAQQPVQEIGSLEWMVAADLKGIFLLRLTVRSDEREYQNTYYFSTEQEQPYKAALAETTTLSGTVRKWGRNNTVILEVENTGTAAALHVCVSDSTDSFLLNMEENFFTLLPGEKRELTVRYRPKFRFGFDENCDQAAKAPVFKAVCLSGAETRELSGTLS